MTGQLPTVPGRHASAPAPYPTIANTHVGAALLIVAALAACTERGGRGAADAGRRTRPDPTDRGAASAAPRWAEILGLEDRRDVDALAALAKSPSPAERRRVALALGRAQAEGSRAPLRRLLVDEAAEVRDAAAFGIGLLGELAADQEERALLGRLAAESAVASRVAITDALGRVGKEATQPALAALLQDPDGPVREQAALALGSFALREIDVGVERVAALGRRVEEDDEPAVRAAAAYALGRIGKLDREGSEPVIAALDRALEHENADVRAMAAKALGAAPPGNPARLLAHVDDPDWRVRVNCIRSIAKRARPHAAQAVRTALRSAWERAGRDGLGTTSVHPLIASLEVAADLVDNPALRSSVQEVHDGALGLRGPATAKDLVHCLAAFALDRAGNWPRFVTSCGTNGMPAWRRTVLEARVLGAGHGDETGRSGRLSKILGAADDARVRTAAVEAAVGIDSEVARRLVVAALGDRDPAVVATAADGIVKLAARLVRTDPEAIRAAQVPDGQEATPAALVPDTRVTDRLVELADRYRAGPEVETLSAIVDALGAMRVRATAERLIPLLRHPVLAVRRKASEAYRAITGEAAPSPGPPLPPSRPIDAPAAEALIGSRRGAVLRTTRGDIRISLLTDDAPATVLNFVALARAGFFGGKAFHRLVPNFVIQGGDPRGDGYGGPGYSIRCEYGSRPYRMGSVGMALAGPDTGGSQFFITHSRQPHLDGRYTLFGEVTTGQDVVDLIVPGDEIRELVIQ